MLGCAGLFCVFVGLFASACGSFAYVWVSFACSWVCFAYMYMSRAHRANPMAVVIFRVPPLISYLCVCIRVEEGGCVCVYMIIE